jgi:hypothetical protein
MTNPYKPYLLSFFETITDFKHNSNRLNKVLLKDVERYTAEGAIYSSGTALIIGDWTGSTDNGWKLPFHTGIDKWTEKESYAKEIKNLLSRELGLSFAQCYEALETLLKDFANVKIISDETFRNSLSTEKYYSRNSLKGCNDIFDLIKKVGATRFKEYSRSSLKGGNDIFDLIKKAGATRFKEYSKKNNNNFQFKEIFIIFSEVRHAITHSQGKLETSKIPKAKYYKELFEHLLPLNKLNAESISLKFEYKTLDHLLIYLAEFGFQIFKILSEEDNYEWNI